MPIRVIQDADNKYTNWCSSLVLSCSSETVPVPRPQCNQETFSKSILVGRKSANPHETSRRCECDPRGPYRMYRMFATRRAIASQSSYFGRRCLLLNLTSVLAEWSALRTTKSAVACLNQGASLCDEHKHILYLSHVGCYIMYLSPYILCI